MIKTLTLEFWKAARWTDQAGRNEHLDAELNKALNKAGVESQQIVGISWQFDLPRTDVGTYRALITYRDREPSGTAGAPAPVYAPGPSVGGGQYEARGQWEGR